MYVLVQLQIPSVVLHEDACIFNKLFVVVLTSATDILHQAMDPTQRPAVVIDCGTGYTKMGFAGNVEPSYIIPTAIGVQDSVQSVQSNKSKKSTPLDDLDFHIGTDALQNSSSYSVKYPIQHGQVCRLSPRGSEFESSR